MSHTGHDKRVVPLALAALGVVFGDIGTSPLYALKECFHGAHGLPVTEPNVLGVLSLVFWSLTMVVMVKYLVFIMRADNRGEGGILALLALLPEPITRGKRGLGMLTMLVIVGAALLYGDGIITPAISVLSAVEGLGVATQAFKPAIVPITCAILIGLFWIQKRGTEAVGRIFGPVMILWFSVLAVLGAIHIFDYPAVLSALSPHHAVAFFKDNGFRGFTLLGSVVLVVTGGEALYADMGHFGLRPIRYAWLVVVMPALLLSYFGQGALVLAHPEAIASPFFAQVPEGVLTYALVALATLATVIASQALISGAFSLTHQAVQLDLFPRVTIRHTSRDTEGQLYIPEINWMLAIGCISLVVIFKSSGALAAAYGLAVTGTMAITSIVYYMVARHTWGWSWLKCASLLALFLAFDLAFLSANSLKFFDGGYVPVLVGFAIFTAMFVWRDGRTKLSRHMVASAPTLSEFMTEMETLGVVRVPGTAVFMASSADRVPPALMNLARRVHAIPERILILTVQVDHQPHVDTAGTLAIQEINQSVHRIVAKTGFFQQANVPKIMDMAFYRLGFKVRRETVTYYVGRETFLATDRGMMRGLPEAIFAFLTRNAKSATSWFGIPGDQVVELGTQIDL